MPDSFVRLQKAFPKAYLVLVLPVPELWLSAVWQAEEKKVSSANVSCRFKDRPFRVWVEEVLEWKKDLGMGKSL